MSKKTVSPKSMWNTPEGVQRANEIVARLSNGDVPGATNLLDKFEDKWDLRGFDFSLRPGDVPFAHYHSDGFILPKWGNTYRDIVIGNADLSHSLFAFADWYDCEFRDCKIEHADLTYSSFKGCSFRKVRFANCWIGNLLGGVTEKNLGVFEDVEFVNGHFTSATFSYPRFERCRFKCDIGHVDFHGSQFYDCVFTGALSAVDFNGKADPGPGEEFMAGRPIPFNPMKNVDFSKARFKPTFMSVSFSGDMDLRDCKFPVKGDVFLVQNCHEVFAEVARRIEMEWNSLMKEKGVENAGFYLDRRIHPMGQVVIKPEWIAKHDGEEFAKAFVKLIKEVMNDIERDEK